MDLERYYELRTILQQWKKRLADSIRGRIENGAHWLELLREIYASEGTEEAFTEWLDRWCRQAAIQFILRVLFLRVLEDRDLLGATRIRTTDGQRMWAQLTRNLGASSYVQWCCRDAAHLLPDLFGPTEYDLVLPDNDLVQRFLDDVWRRPDPNREGRLRFDFRPDPARGDEGFETRFIGDLYQELDAEIRARYALLQTPHFISQFILEHTLLKRFEEKDFREVTLLDPTGGSGHFYVDAFWMFVERYEQASGRGRHGLSSAERAQIARAIIEKHLFGCDINPYAMALARFRLTLAACDYAQPTSLRGFRDLRFNLVTIDSLIPYEKLMMGNWRVGSALAQAFGQPEAIERALPVLRRRYDAVVGNPPYITVKDDAKRSLYREHYESAYRSYGLSAPFTERFLQLAMEGGTIGLINSNAFARRQFGKKLIEEVLPRHDLESVIDLSGAHIPGHGTPTLIMFGRNRAPTRDSILVISNLRGEPRTPSIPSEGRVWLSILQGLQSESEFTNEFVDVAARPRSLLAQHPWKFGGPTSRLAERLEQSSTLALAEILVGNGRDVHTGLNDVYFAPIEFFRRIGISHRLLFPIASGSDVRDWYINPSEYALFPYLIADDLELIDLQSEASAMRYLSRYKSILDARKNYGQTVAELDMAWYEYTYVSNRDWSERFGLGYPVIATHNHYAVSSRYWIGDRHAPRLSLAARHQEKVSRHDYLMTAALLNTSVVCLYLKQVCFDKRAGRDPVRDTYYEFAVANVDRIPLPRERFDDTRRSSQMLAATDEMVALSDRLSALGTRKLFEKAHEGYHAWYKLLDGYIEPDPHLPPPFTTAHELRKARERLASLRQDIRARMIFLQEEMDWLAYGMYGLLKGKAPLAEDYLSRAEYEAARLELGQRPFEVAGKGYQGDWPEGYEPPPLPEALRPLTEARMVIMEANSDIALLEDPLYKRRWIPPDYEQEFRDAAEGWVAEKLEWALEQHGKPISLRLWARLMGRDERVTAALEVLTGTQMYDLDEELLKVIQANAVPNRPEHYLKPEGLRRFHAAQTNDPPATPQYKRDEFGDSTAWKVRGKLNIPRERFVSYTEFDHTQRGVDAPDSGGPWFGWAGWDPAQRADALAFLLDQANRAGWEQRWRQCGLRAALRDLLPDLRDLPAADRAEFEAIASMCGIGLGTACYCQAYRDGIARGEPGVPGVDAEVLGVKVVVAETKASKRRRKKAQGDVEQMSLGLDA